MEVKGAGDLPGVTAQEIWDSHFRNELEEGGQTEPIWRAAGFLAEHGHEAWEYRETTGKGTIWQAGLGRSWLVNPDKEEILKLEE